MKKIVIVLLIAVSLLSLNAVFDDYGSSARARGMGGAFYSVSNDASAVFYNPAGLVYAGNNVIVGYTDLWSTGYNSLINGAVSYNLGKAGTIGLGYQFFDVSYEDVTLQSEKTVGIFHGFTVMKDIHTELTMGYGVNLYNIEFYDQNDSQTAFGINIGALATVRQRTRLAFSVTNVNNPKIGKDYESDLPQVFVIGLSHVPYEKVTTSIELKQEFGEETQVMGGLEISPHDMVTLRGGVHNKPNVISFGVGFNVNNMLVDYGYNSHSNLDGIHQVAIGYKF